MHQQIVKVDRVGFEQSLLVRGIDARDNRVDMGSHRFGMTSLILFRRNQIVLRFADSSKNFRCRKVCRIEIEILQDAF